jgi:broad specificity phosphatase PhoE
MVYVTGHLIEVVFETHMTSEDNEQGIATGWLPGRLSDAGRQQARELGARRRAERLTAVFTSDLARAVETAEIAFAGLGVPILHDWRLRECDYGDRNGMTAKSCTVTGPLIWTARTRTASRGDNRPHVLVASSKIYDGAGAWMTACW